MRYILLSLLLLATSCIGLSIELNEMGAKVPLRTELPKESASTFEKMKYIHCEVGANGRSMANNDQSCENYLRNEAGRIGAEFVLVDTKHGDGASNHYGKTCNNCFVAAGWAYRKGKAKTQQPSDEQTENATPFEMGDSDEDGDKNNDSGGGTALGGAPIGMPGKAGGSGGAAGKSADASTDQPTRSRTRYTEPKDYDPAQNQSSREPTSEQPNKKPKKEAPKDASDKAKSKK